MYGYVYIDMIPLVLKDSGGSHGSLGAWKWISLSLSLPLYIYMYTYAYINTYYAYI